MKPNKLPRIIYCHLLPLICCTLISGCAKEAKWTDKALLHDGRILEVRRTTEYPPNPMRFLGAVSPERHSLKAINPYSGKNISWSDEAKVEPIMLDFFDKTPYLVVFGGVFTNIDKYGCPNLPYVYLKYNEQTSVWTSINNGEVQDVLHIANLSVGYDRWNGEDYVYVDQDSEEITRNNNYGVGSYFSVNIPKNFEEWSYSDKDKFGKQKEEHDCRLPKSELDDAINPKSPIPPSRNVTLEILEKKEYEPVRRIDNNDTTGHSQFSQLVGDKKRYQACKLLFKPLENHSYSQNQLWRTFVSDPTGKKTIRNGDNLLCESNTIWLIDYSVEKGKVVIVKASISGDVIYRVSFDKPDDSFGYSGFIVDPTLESRDGYIYFDWWIAHDNNKYWEVKRSTKVRFPEPANSH